MWDGRNDLPTFAFLFWCYWRKMLFRKSFHENVTLCENMIFQKNIFFWTNGHKLMQFCAFSGPYRHNPTTGFVSNKSLIVIFGCFRRLIQRPNGTLKMCRNFMEYIGPPTEKFCGPLAQKWKKIRGLWAQNVSLSPLTEVPGNSDFAPTLSTSFSATVCPFHASRVYFVFYKLRRIHLCTM